MRAVFLVLLACAPAYADASSCVEGAPYDADTLGDRVAFLASEQLDGRAPGSEGDKAARAFIVERFTCLGLAPGGKDGGYEQPFQDGAKHATANAVGFIQGTDAKVGSEIIVLGAHHDHLGSGHLGANDNASGVVALLAIAQAIKQHGAPKRTIAFVTFGAEEQGMVGSDFYVAHAPAALPIKNVVQYINLDMVGSYASKGFVAAMGTFPKLVARKALDKLDLRNPKLHVGVGGRARGSDHLPFCKLGIPYVFFWTPDARCYHETCDTAANLDRKHMAQIAELAGDLAWALAQSDADLAAARAKLGCGTTATPSP